MIRSGGDRAGRRWRILWRVAGLLLLIVLANLVSAWLVDILKIELTPRTEHIFHRVIMASAVMYGLLIAIPFVPAVEIGVALMVVVGPGIAVLVYVATVVGLFAAFLVGHFLPRSWLTSALQYFHLTRVSRLIGQLERLGLQERLAFLMSRAPGRIVPPLLRHRYLAVAVALNVPGNAVIGGGGGISMMAGLSKLYAVPGYLLMLVIAVAPVPLAVLMFGQEILPQ